MAGLVFEHSGRGPLAAGETDGMLELMAAVDEPTSTDWDADAEPPPHAGLRDDPAILALWPRANV